jgi:hypothetical protein
MKRVTWRPDDETRFEVERRSPVNSQVLVLTRYTVALALHGDALHQSLAGSSTALSTPTSPTRLPTIATSRT